MKIRHRELKIALVDNRDENFDDFFLPQNMKLFVSSPRRIFEDVRSSSSQRPGISKDYEHGKALAHSSALRAPRNPILVFLIFSVGILVTSYALQTSKCVRWLSILYLKLHVV